MPSPIPPLILVNNTVKRTIKTAAPANRAGNPCIQGMVTTTFSTGCLRGSTFFASPRRPGPAHEPRVEVTNELLRAHPAARGVQDRATQLARREPFPGHAERREMPVRRAGNTGSRLIRILVTSPARQSGRSPILGTPGDIHGVAVTIVSLARKITARVTVQATRMKEHRDHALKERRRLCARALAGAICTGHHHAQTQSRTPPETKRDD